MRSAGFTLIELLIVISIMAIMAVVGFVNFKGFSADQVTVKAVGQIQTYLRLAQSNATSGTKCGTTGGAPWALLFNRDQKHIMLTCGTNNIEQKNYILDGAEIESIKGSECDRNTSVIPFTLVYSSGVGALTFTGDSISSTCLASDVWTFTIKNTKNNTTKSFKVSKGGAIDVQ